MFFLSPRYIIFLNFWTWFKFIIWFCKRILIYFYKNIDHMVFPSSIHFFKYPLNLLFKFLLFSNLDISLNFSVYILCHMKVGHIEPKTSRKLDIYEHILKLICINFIWCELCRYGHIELNIVFKFYYVNKKLSNNASIFF